MGTLAYGKLALLSAPTLALGLAFSPAMIAGSYLGKRIVGRLPDRAFQLLIEVVLIIAGLQLLITG